MSKNDNGYQRKTMDYYKLERFVNGEWTTVIDTDDFGEYQALYYKLIAFGKSHTTYRGRKYRRVIG